MALMNTRESYGSVAKFFHWLIAIVILVQIIYGFFLESVPKDYQPFAYNTHKLIGLTLLLMMVLRLCWALVNVKPELPIGTLPWQRFAERFVHTMLYFVVIVMPISGLIGSNASGKPPHIGDFKFTLPVPEDKALVDTAFAVHNTLALVLIGLLVVHVGATLYHHYIKKDNILRRMLPSCCRKS